MLAAGETFDGTWPYEPHFFEGNGFLQHYIDEGSTKAIDDTVIICLHGEPTRGYLCRNSIPRLSKVGRVIVPDHMGFGKSETPQDRRYSFREHSDNFERLLLSLDLKNIALIMQDWGGPIGSSFAIRHPNLIKCLCYCNANVSWARVPVDPLPEFKWLTWVNSEQYEPTISNLGSTVLSVMKRIGIERAAHVGEIWVRAQSSAFPATADCRGAIQFPRNITDPKTFEFIKELYEKHGVEALQSLPAMCVVGEEDRTTPADIRAFGFKSLWPNGPVIRREGVGHFLQEDAPETVAALIEQFVQVNNPPVAEFAEPSREWNESSRWASASRQ